MLEVVTVPCEDVVPLVPLLPPFEDEDPLPLEDELLFPPDEEPPPLVEELAPMPLLPVFPVKIRLILSSNCLRQESGMLIKFPSLCLKVFPDSLNHHMGGGIASLWKNFIGILIFVAEKQSIDFERLQFATIGAEVF